MHFKIAWHFAFVCNHFCDDIFTPSTDLINDTPQKQNIQTNEKNRDVIFYSFDFLNCIFGIALEVKHIYAVIDLYGCNSCLYLCI
jgi:hypothetical protein